jgi:hypothetical protein
VTFKKAVADTPDLENAWYSGLKALRKVDAKHIKAEDTKRLKGSIDLDGALKKKLPNAPIWDYGIGHKPSNHPEEMVYWVEIHPASDGEITSILAKLDWLKTWLGNEAATTLNGMRREFLWVSSGKTSFTVSSTQQKKLAQHGLQHKGRIFKIPDEAAS